MRRAFFVILAVIPAGLACADTAAAVKLELTANYALISKAFVQQDASKIEALMTKEYIVIQPNGEGLAHDHVLQAMRWQMRSMRNPKWDRKVRSVTVRGSKAIAIVDGDFSGTMTAPDGKTHLMRLVSTSKDTWVKVGKRYLLRQSNVQKSVATMDGRVMTPTTGRRR